MGENKNKYKNITTDTGNEKNKPSDAFDIKLVDFVGEMLLRGARPLPIIQGQMSWDLRHSNAGLEQRRLVSATRAHTHAHARARTRRHT